MNLIYAETNTVIIKTEVCYEKISDVLSVLIIEESSNDKLIGTNYHLILNSELQKLLEDHFYKPEFIRGNLGIYNKKTQNQVYLEREASLNIPELNENDELVVILEGNIKKFASDLSYVPISLDMWKFQPNETDFVNIEKHKKYISNVNYCQDSEELNFDVDLTQDLFTEFVDKVNENPVLRQHCSMSWLQYSVTELWEVLNFNTKNTKNRKEK